MPNIIANHLGIPFTQLSIQDAVNQIKLDYEQAIAAGTTAKMIRTGKLIKLIHQAVKHDFININIHPSLVNPSPRYLQRVVNPKAKRYNKARKLGDQELQLAGFLKTKKQDIAIIPDNIHIRPEKLNLSSMLHGVTDIYGYNFTESILSINVRSQLSSVDKNFDTLYERTFAESLNLHLRFPNMVLGEVYLIPTGEYTEASTRENMVFKKVNLAKYIQAFRAINLRTGKNDEKYKYERCCLLVVNFERNDPKIYNSTDELIQDGFLPQGSTASMAGLDYLNFVNDIWQIYTARFPNNTFI